MYCESCNEDSCDVQNRERLLKKQNAMLLASLKRCRVLVSLLTVRQVMDAGDKAIDASGLNPWCMNEGLATGGEQISASFIDFAIAEAEMEGN